MNSAPLSVVIPSRTQDYLSNLFQTFDRSEPGWVTGTQAHVYVVDNGIETPHPIWWFRYRKAVSMVKYPWAEFNFARAVNLGLERWAGEGVRGLAASGAVVMNDDTEVVSPNFFTTMSMALVDPDLAPLGIMSPQILGGVGNRDQAVSVPSPWSGLTTQHTICFVSALIRQTCYEDVGPLDERFTGYGWEDNDYCLRAVRAGFRLGVVAGASVAHGSVTGIMHGTFGRGKTPEEMRALFLRGKQIFVDKWGEAAVGPLDARPVQLLGRG